MTTNQEAQKELAQSRLQLAARPSVVVLLSPLDAELVARFAGRLNVLTDPKPPNGRER